MRCHNVTISSTNDWHSHHFFLPHPPPNPWGYNFQTIAFSNLLHYSIFGHLVGFKFVDSVFCQSTFATLQGSLHLSDFTILPLSKITWGAFSLHWQVYYIYKVNLEVMLEIFPIIVFFYNSWNNIKFYIINTLSIFALLYNL